jgi:hypothetical protein
VEIRYQTAAPGFMGFIIIALHFCSTFIELLGAAGREGQQLAEIHRLGSASGMEWSAVQ